MEFYVKSFYLDIISNEFQFPTGWNSTSNLALFLLFVVGFNSQRDGILLSPKILSKSSSRSFNSQWDGILRFWRCFRGYARKVSIPNGMEFYDHLYRLYLSHRRFQFPTGWNSTLCPICQWKRSSRFQFPTGWNSTFLGSSYKVGLCCFNSQRDGILLIEAFKDVYMILFQFPTGWNSTLLKI